ncbi:MAG: NAD-binding protein [Cellulosilyticaceae bacterium]
MFVVILGCGRIGSSLAEELSREGHNVSVIDTDEEKLARLGSAFNGLTVQGVGIDEDVLRRAGIESADVFIAVTQQENTNLMAAQIAKKIFGIQTVIARNDQPTLDVFYQQLGLETIYPTKEIVHTIKNKMFHAS